MKRRFRHHIRLVLVTLPLPARPPVLLMLFSVTSARPLCSQRERERERGREGKGERERERERETDRQTDRQTDRHRER